VRVTVWYSPAPRVVRDWELALPARATVRDALDAAGLLAKEQVAVPATAIGVWGRKARLDQPLRERDRVEIYRPLEVDPKMARRERFRRQGARAAGLFARKKAPRGGP
jgi:uncharacterized protein